MNILDWVIVVAGIGYAVSGFRNGAVVGLCSMAGFFGGAIAGAQVAGPLGAHLASGRAQIPVAILSVLLASLLGQMAAVWAGGRLRQRFVRDRAQTLDSGVGSVLGVFSVLLVAWMVAVPLASSPFPTLSAAAGHSRIVRGVNQVMPKGVRSLYASLRSFLDQSGFPPVLGDLPPSSVTAVAAPPASLPADVLARVQRAHRSIVKVYGEAPSCGRGIEGSGFVIAAHRVLTNAHVVAGTSQVGVQLSGGQLAPATVVGYDPQRDVAVLDVPGLDAPALSVSAATPDTGQPALVLGYPEDGPFTIRAARVRSRETIVGNDIYGDTQVRRDIYALRATVRSGNSGGPLLGEDGTVLGVVFATALDSSDTGYALTDAEVAPDLRAGISAQAAVSTGRCTPEG